MENSARKTLTIQAIIAVLPSALRIGGTALGLTPYRFRLMGSDMTAAGWETPNILDMGAFVDFAQ
jgi:hypothetical protein